MSVIIVPCRLMWFMGDWEQESFQWDHCAAGFDQTTVMQPESTKTVSMKQAAKEENVNPPQTASTTTKNPVNTVKSVQSSDHNLSLKFLLTVR